jgi:hypothetical protein
MFNYILFNEIYNIPEKGNHIKFTLKNPSSDTDENFISSLKDRVAAREMGN